MTKLLVDGDIVLYTSSVATEFACDWGGGNWVLSSNLPQSQDIARRYLDELVDTLKATEVVLCLSGPDNFRAKLNPSYKANRKDIRKPIVYPALREWMFNNFTTECYLGLEADDVMGILATRDPQSIIVSADKDMQCVPGKLYRQGEVITTTLEQANYYHMLQTLTGDATDGYPGCPGTGPVGARKALQGPPEGHWETVVKLYEKAGLTEEDALMNARMAYILRDENFKNGEITLWQPPTSSK